MASELPWMSPLNSLFHLTKLNRGHLQLPDDNHLVITTTCEILAIGRESYHVDSWLVTSLQIILVSWLVAHLSITNCNLELLLVWTWAQLGGDCRTSNGGCLICRWWCVLDFVQFPQSDATIVFCALTCGDKVVWIGKTVNGHDSSWLIMPAYLWHFYLHAHLLFRFFYLGIL